MRHLVILSASACVACAAAGDAITADYFTATIKPILAKSCVECHGPAKAKEDLRLDTPEGIRKGSHDKTVLVPGKPAESLIYTLSATSSKEDRMPPKGDPLSAEQLAALKRWIEAGAPMPEAAPAAK